MRFSRKAYTIFVGCVAACFLFGCSTTKESNTESEDNDPLVVERDSDTSVPTAEEAEARVQKELKELEESLAEEAKSRSVRSLTEQAEAFGAVARKVNGSQDWIISKGGRTLTLKEDSRIASLDGVTVMLDRPLSKERGKWTLGASDERILLENAFGKGRSGIGKVETIVIDPGHGGSEEGAKNEKLGLTEKDMNLDLAVRLQKHLESLGFKTVFTRYDDRLVELAKRPEIANASKAHLFVSLHFNSAPNAEAHGLETYLFTPAGEISSGDVSVDASEAVAFPGNRFDLDSFDLAYRIQKSMIDRLKREDRGVKKARFAVLKSLNSPGVLVECGFLSNAAEAQLIGTAGYRERLAQALAEGIAAYVGNDS